MHRIARPLIAALVCTAAAALVQAQPVQVGEAVPVDVATQHPYTPSATDAPAWRHVFQRDRAAYVALHFERFDLADGDRVVISHPTGARSVTYTGRGKAEMGTFWATHIPGDTAIVELHTESSEPGFGFVIDQVAYGFPPERMPRGADGPDSPCGTNDQLWAQCFSETEPAVYERGRAVARLLINGTGACTGWLVGCEGHLMTNNHCVEDADDALNTDYEFMAERSCATGCSFWWACPGEVVASSGTLLSTDAGLDYSLIELPVDPTPDYGFLTLRSDGPALGEQIYIVGHPNGYGKRVSFDSDHPMDPDDLCTVTSLNEPGCSGGSADIGYFCDTEGGNSGSPTLAYADHRVVALHHCGSCPNRGVAIDAIISHIGDALPECSLDVNIRLTTLAPARAGTVNTLTVVGATPGSNNVVLLSPLRGTTQVPTCPDAQLGLAQVRVLGSAVADDDGNAQLEFTVPGAFGGRTAYFQAVEIESCSVSNVVESTLDIAGAFVVPTLAHEALAGNDWVYGYRVDNGGSEPLDVEFTTEHVHPDGTVEIVEGPTPMSVEPGGSIDATRELILTSDDQNGPHTVRSRLTDSVSGELVDLGEEYVELRGGAADAAGPAPLVGAEPIERGVSTGVSVSARVVRNSLWRYVYTLSNLTEDNQTVQVEVWVTDPLGEDDRIEGPRTVGVSGLSTAEVIGGWFVNGDAGRYEARVEVLDTDGEPMSTSDTIAFEVVETGP